MATGTRTATLMAGVLMAMVGVGGCAPEPTSSQSRRTTVEDVTIANLAAHPLPTGWVRAAVPVDAWPARQVLLDATPTDVAVAREAMSGKVDDSELVVQAALESCLVIAVWALPEPALVRVGHESHPTLTCVRARKYAVLFVIPRSGDNSEGHWAYGAEAPRVVLESRVGSHG